MRGVTGTQLHSPDRFEALLSVLFTGLWVQRRNLSDSAVLNETLAQAGFDPQVFHALAADSEVKAALKQATEAAGELNVALHAAHLGQPIQLFAEARAQGIDVHPGQGEQWTNGAAILIDQRSHQMDGFDELVVTTQCQRLGIGNSNLEFAGQAIEAHCTPPLKQTRRFRGKQHNFLR